LLQRHSSPYVPPQSVINELRVAERGGAKDWGDPTPSAGIPPEVSRNQTALWPLFLCILLLRFQLRPLPKITFFQPIRMMIGLCQNSSDSLLFFFPVLGGHGDSGAISLGILVACAPTVAPRVSPHLPKWIWLLPLDSHLAESKFCLRVF